MSELEQVVFDTTRAQMGPALGIDKEEGQVGFADDPKRPSMKKSRTLSRTKRRFYEQYALGEIDLETYQERKAVYDAESGAGKKCPCRYYRTDQTDTE